MSSRIAERAPEPKLGLLSLRHPVSSQPVTLEVQADNRTATIRMVGASLEITEDAFEQFMENLMQLPSHPGRALGLKAVISIPRLLPVPNALSSSSMRGLGELSITMSTEIQVGLTSLDLRK